MGVQFSPGKNIALKVPSFEFEKTIGFYKEIMRFKQCEEFLPDIAFDFDGKVLWIDKVDTLSQAEIWLEIKTENIGDAEKYLSDKGIQFCNQIEELPSGFEGFWIMSPSNLVHLVTSSP